jgi:undecaprenyl diphosphate synthase
MTPGTNPTPFPGIHAAIIMDGNGRWATLRGLPRVAGHRAGVETVRKIVEAAPGAGVGTLTIYAFSADNWERPRREVSTLFDLLGQYIRLSDTIRREMERMEEQTSSGRNLHLRIAVDYSSREAVLRAIASLEPGVKLTREEFLRKLNAIEHPGIQAPEVDLLIRTGGEQRLSDFLMWEGAYAELYFTPTLWPDFMEADLEAAMAEFHRRERRFGRVADAAAG